MKNQIQNASASIGNALLPFIRNLIEPIGKLANWFLNLSEGTKKFIVIVGSLLVGGGILLTLFGGMLMFIANLTTAFTVLAGAGITFGTVMAILTSPITIIIALIGAIIAMVILMRKAWVENWNGVQDKVKSVCDNIKNWWKGVADWFTNNPIIANVKSFFSGETTQQRIANKKGQKSAWGTKRVVGNDVPYRLHSGEKVLTRTEADNYEKGMNLGNGISINIENMTIREEADINKVAKELVDRLNRSRLAFAGGY